MEPFHSKPNSDDEDPFYSKPGVTFSVTLKRSQEKYWEMFQSQKYSDLILICRNVEFKVHRIIVASESPYLDKALSENETLDAISLDFDPDLIALVVEFIYRGQLCNLQLDIAESLAQIARQLKMDQLEKHCCKAHLQNLTPTIENCLQALTMAETCREKDLKEKFHVFALENFSRLRRHRSLANLTLDSVKRYIVHTNLSVNSQEDRLSAAIFWLKFNSPKQLGSFPSLLKCLPLDKMSKPFLEQIIDNSVVCDHAVSVAILTAALEKESPASPPPVPQRSLKINQIVTPPSECIEEQRATAPPPRDNNMPQNILTPPPRDYTTPAPIALRAQTDTSGQTKLEEKSTCTTPETIISEDLAGSLVPQEVLPQPGKNPEEFQPLQQHKDHGVAAIWWGTPGVQLYLSPFKSLLRIIDLPKRLSGSRISNAACCSAGELLYLSGVGFDNRQVCRYDVIKRQWDEYGLLGRARIEHCMAVCGNKLLVLAGSSPGSPNMITMVESLNLSEKTWIDEGTLKGTSCFRAACCVYDQCHVILLGAFQNKALLQVYSTLTYKTIHSIELPSQYGFESRSIVLAGEHLIFNNKTDVYICPRDSLYRDIKEEIIKVILYSAPNTDAMLVLSNDEKELFLLGGSAKSNRVYRSRVEDVIKNQGNGWSPEADEWAEDSAYLPGTLCPIVIHKSLQQE